MYSGFPNDLVSSARTDRTKKFANEDVHKQIGNYPWSLVKYVFVGMFLFPNRRETPF